MAKDSFSEKVCVVTGAASGIGRELTLQLARAGARVFAADLNEAALSGLEEAGVETLPVDVRDAEAVGALVAEAVERGGRLDYLFNNAGVAGLGEVKDLPLAEWRRVLDVNLFGVINGVHAAYPVMIRQGGGHIVNMASLSGLFPTPSFIPYSTSKFAVVGLSRALAIEAARYGVRVTAVCPSFIDTAMVRQFEAGPVLGLVPVERAARLILEGVARRRALVIFPRSARVLLFLDRIAPVGRWIGAGLLARYRAEQSRIG